MYSGEGGRLLKHMRKGKSKKEEKKPTSNKQMKKCGEPLRKGKREDLAMEEVPEKESMGKDKDQGAQKLTRKEERMRREERRVAREVRRQRTKENKLKKEKKKKLAKEKLKRNKNQLVLRGWLKGGSMVLPNQGGTGGGKTQGGAKKGGTKKGIG